MMRVLSEKTSALHSIDGGEQEWQDQGKTKLDARGQINGKMLEGQCSIQKDCSTEPLAIDPADFNFTHVLKYFKDHVDPKAFLAARDKVDAMIDEGFGAVQIRQAMTDEDCTPLFVEAILIGQSKHFVKTNAMIKAGIAPSKIFQHLTEEEGGDPELVKAIIETGTGHDFGPILVDSKNLRDRDPRAFRAVSDLVSKHLAIKMKRVGVPEGGIRQKLARLGIGSDNIATIMCKVNEDANVTLRRRLSAESRRSQHSQLDSDSSHNESEDEEEYDSDSSCEDEEDPALRLRTAVLRRIKDMVECGTSDVEIREKLIAMKCVDQELVDCFLNQVHPTKDSRECQEPRDSLAQCDNAILREKILVMYRAGVSKAKIEDRIFSHPSLSRKEFNSFFLQT